MDTADALQELAQAIVRAGRDLAEAIHHLADAGQNISASIDNHANEHDQTRTTR